jgi:hypothetical protein
VVVCFGSGPTKLNVSIWVRFRRIATVVRYQLARSFQKTNARTQAKLVAGGDWAFGAHEAVRWCPACRHRAL